MIRALIDEWHWLLQRRRIGLALVGTALAMLGAAYGSFQLVSAALDPDLPLLGAQMGRVFAVSLCLGLQGWMMILAPPIAITAHDLAMRYQIAYTPARLLARLLAIWGTTGLILTVALPFFSLLPLFGSVSLAEIGWALAVALVTALLGGVYGLCLAALLRQVPAALFASYGALALWLVIVWALAATTTMTTPPDAVVFLIALNPFAAILAPLAPAFPPVGPIADDLQGIIRLTHGAIARHAPLHYTYLAGSGLLMMLLFWVTSIVERPLPRRWLRLDILLGALTALYLLGLFWSRSWWWPITR